MKNALLFRSQPAEGNRHGVPVPSCVLCSSKSQVRPLANSQFTCQLTAELAGTFIHACLFAVRSDPVRRALGKERRRRPIPTPTPPPHPNQQGKVRLGRLCQAVCLKHHRNVDPSSLFVFLSLSLLTSTVLPSFMSLLFSLLSLRVRRDKPDLRQSGCG